MNISKLRDSRISRLMQKSMQFPKHRKSGFPLYEKGMEKHKHFKFMGFLIFWMKQKSIQFPELGKSEFP